MAVNRRRTVNDVAYGLTNPSQSLASKPIISRRNPTANDNAPLGTLWVNTVSGAYFVITSVVAGVANWQAQQTGAGNFASVTITGAGTALDVTTGDIEVAGNSTLTGTLTVGGFTQFTESITVQGVGLLAGAGSPVGLINAAHGSLYMRTDGSSTTTRLYVNSNGATAWIPLVAAA